RRIRAQRSDVGMPGRRGYRRKRNLPAGDEGMVAMTTPSFPPEFPWEPSRHEPRRDPPREPAGAPPRGVPATPSAADLLFDRRIVFANGRIDGDLATDLSAQLIMLDGGGDGPIALHLRAPDADLEAAFAVADTIGILSSPVNVVVIGQAGGPALLILAAG